MNNIILKRVALASTALTAVITAPAFAQHTSTGDMDPETIIVTARRVEERLQDVPISITVYNQEEIAKRNIINSAELGTYTPSLSTNSRFGPEKASFAIRGFVQDFATAPSVGVYFADVVAPRSGSSITSGNGVGVGNLFDLQNVQVLKGPQGTLFGRNTTGGAVLLVPQKPTDRLEGYVEGSAGNYDMWRGQAVANVPLSDTFKVRLGVDRMKRDGYLRNHSGIGPDRLGNINYTSARLSIVADLTPDLENYTIATYTDSRNHGVIGRGVGCATPAQVTNFLMEFGSTFGCAQLARQTARGDGWWDVENSVPDPIQHTESWQVLNTTTWLASDTLTVKNIVSYAEFRETMRASLVGENYLLPNGSPFLSLIRFSTTPGLNNGSQSTFTEELQFQGRTPNGKLNWQAGGYLETSDPLGYSSYLVPFLLNCTNPQAYQCAQGVNFSIGGNTIFVSNIQQPWYKTWWRSKGLYAQGNYNFTDQLSMTAGLRYTWDSMSHFFAGTGVGFPADNTPAFYCSNQLGNPGPGGSLKMISQGDFHQCDLKFSTKSDKPTWTVGVEYKPTTDAMVFAKYSRGYRAGGVNTPYNFFETWQPEKVDTYEVGAKTSFRSSSIRGNFNITGFYNDFRNQQIQAALVGKVGAPVLSGTGIINAGKSRIWGVEVDAGVTLFDSLNIVAGYTYLNTKLVSLTGIPAPDPRVWAPGDTPWQLVVPTAIVGEPLALSPKNRFTITGTYTLPLDESVGKISIGATFVHTDKQTSSQATLPQWAILPSSNLLNLNASWSGVMGLPVDLSAFVTNVTNAKFPVSVTQAFPSFGFESQSPNEPRMWGMRLKYRFGQ